MITESDSMNSEEFKNYFVIHPSYRKYKYNTKKYFHNSLNNSKFLKSHEIKALILKNLKDFPND